MRHLKGFLELFESSSAGSQGTNGVAPFKYAKLYDPRIGYNKVDFVEDLKIIYNDLDVESKKNLLHIIESFTGQKTLESSVNIPTSTLNKLMKAVSDFLDSKSDFELFQYPDGYVLCFEDVVQNTRLYDIYFNPDNDKIKISYQTGSTIEPEDIVKIDSFAPEKFGISDTDFDSTIRRARSLFKRKETSDKSGQ